MCVVNMTEPLCLFHVNRIYKLQNMVFIWRYQFMDRFLYPRFTLHFRKPGWHLLSVTWVIGLAAGFFVSSFANSSFFHLMRSAILCKVSIVSLLLSTSLPFFFSVFAFYSKQQWLIVPACFVKAFLFSIIAHGLLFSYGTTGWLFVVFLLFCDICTIPLLWLFWLCHLNKDEALRILDFVCFCGICICVVGIYYYWIVPFLANHII